MKTTIIALAGIGLLATAACTSDPYTNQRIGAGAAIGAIGGAIVGNNVGDGNTAAGAAIGAAAGAAVGAASANNTGGVDRRQYYDQRAGRYYYYDQRTGRYFWENGQPR